MSRRVVLLSGPIASGKSSLAASLRTRFGAELIHTRELVELAVPPARRARRDALQAAGERLDKRTNGEWIVESLHDRLSSVPADALVIIDAVRHPGQIESLRRAFGTRVTHVHLTAPEATLAARYEERRATTTITELASYADVRRNVTERRIEKLASDADIVIDTDRNQPPDVLVRAAARLGLRGGRRLPLVDVLVGGQYGSEGKGNVAAYLSPEYDLLVRSGGPNAGHSVMTDDGKHVQYHLPSGTKLCDAKLLLTSGAVIDPEGLLDEIARSDVDRERLMIDPHAMVITSAHKSAEAGAKASIGSTGQGVGAATADRITGRGGPLPLLAKDVPALKPYLSDAFDVLDDAYAASQRIFVEGTQGTGLSLLHGHYPYVTSRETTVSGLLAEAGIPPARVRRVVMVCRTHPIRVQSPKGSTSGPMSHEIEWATVAARSGLDLDTLLAQEKTTTTKRDRRVSEFDWDLLHRASILNAPTDIAVTFADQIDVKNENARRYEQLTDDTIRFIEEVEHVAGAPVTLVSSRFHRRSIIDRRTW